MVYNTKQLYIGVRTGNLKEIMADHYAENKKLNARLDYESNLYHIFV